MIRDDQDDNDEDNDDEGYRVYNEEEDIPARVVVNVRVTKLSWWWKYGTSSYFHILNPNSRKMQKAKLSRVSQQDLQLAEFYIVA